MNIPYAEFYITHVCNLACPGCNRFNDVNFKGYQKWQDYADIYKRWSEELSIGSMAILGGEPLLNPTFMDWARGITSLWPKTNVRIITNGFQLNHVHGLYDLVCERPGLKLWVGIHNKMHKKDIISRVCNFLIPPVVSEYDGSIPYQEKLYLTDKNGVRIVVEYNWWFHQGAIIKTENGLSLHQSDPNRSHKICHMKTCHTFFQGRLYKCGVVAVLPDFDKQFNLQIDPQDRDLLYSYQPLSIQHTLQEKKDFIKKLPMAIDQCKFCPEVYDGNQIWSKEKKMTFIRTNDGK